MRTRFLSALLSVALVVSTLGLGVAYVVDQAQQRAAGAWVTCPPICYCLKCQLRRQPKPKPQPEPTKPTPAPTLAGGNVHP